VHRWSAKRSSGGWFLRVPIVGADSDASYRKIPELSIGGDIPAKLTVNANDLARMPREIVSVADQDGTKVNHEGVSLRRSSKVPFSLGLTTDIRLFFRSATWTQLLATNPSFVAGKRDGVDRGADMV
jgi:hypothetical protein